eukprot:COSAG01_NODE_12705_length_1697_cov_1.588235_4_plen_81_part_00
MQVCRMGASSQQVCHEASAMLQQAAVLHCVGAGGWLYEVCMCDLSLSQLPAEYSSLYRCTTVLLYYTYYTTSTTSTTYTI